MSSRYTVNSIIIHEKYRFYPLVNGYKAHCRQYSEVTVVSILIKRRQYSGNTVVSILQGKVNV